MATIPVIGKERGGIGGSVAGPPVQFGPIRAFSQLGKTVSSAVAAAAIALKTGRDNAKAGESFNNYREASRQKVVELRSLEGADAAGALADYEAWETEWRSANNENLENNAQRLALNSKLDPYSSSHKDSLAFHAATEHKKYIDSVAASSVANAKADVVVDPFNPSAYSLAISDGVDAINAANPGKDNTSLILRFKAETAAVKAMSMMNVSPALAGKFIEKERVTLGGAYAPLKEELHRAEVKQGSQREADEIMSEKPGFEEQLNAARDIEEPDLRDATVARIKARHEELKKFTNERNQKIQNGLANGIEKAPDIEAAMDIALGAPTQEMSSKLITYAKAVKNVGDNPTQYTELEKARIKIDKGEITSIEQLGVEYMSSVGDKWDSLVKYFDEGGNQGQIKDTTLSTAIQFRKKGFNPKKSEDDAQVLQVVREFVEKNIEPGKFPTDKIVADLVSTALMSGERMGGGFGYGDDATYIEAFKAGHAATWLPDVADDIEITEIEVLLKQNGEKVTDFNVRLYKRVQMLKLPMTPALRAVYEAQEAETVLEVGQ